MCHLFHLLRPEFVKKYPKPLCSDSFSNFLDPEETHFNDDAREATKYLYEQLVPQFIQHAIQILKSGSCN